MKRVFVIAVLANFLILQLHASDDGFLTKMGKKIQQHPVAVGVTAIAATCAVGYRVFDLLKQPSKNNVKLDLMSGAPVRGLGSGNRTMRPMDALAYQGNARALREHEENDDNSWLDLVPDTILSEPLPANPVASLIVIPDRIAEVPSALPQAELKADRSHAGSEPGAQDRRAIADAESKRSHHQHALSVPPHDDRSPVTPLNDSPVGAASAFPSPRTESNTLERARKEEAARREQGFREMRETVYNALDAFEKEMSALRGGQTNLRADLFEVRRSLDVHMGGCKEECIQAHNGIAELTKFVSRQRDAEFMKDVTSRIAQLIIEVEKAKKAPDKKKLDESLNDIAEDLVLAQGVMNMHQASLDRIVMQQEIALRQQIVGTASQYNLVRKAHARAAKKREAAQPVRSKKVERKKAANHIFSLSDEESEDEGTAVFGKTRLLPAAQVEEAERELEASCNDRESKEADEAIRQGLAITARLGNGNGTHRASAVQNGLRSPVNGKGTMTVSAKSPKLSDRRPKLSIKAILHDQSPAVALEAAAPTPVQNKEVVSNGVAASADHDKPNVHVPGNGAHANGVQLANPQNPTDQELALHSDGEEDDHALENRLRAGEIKPVDHIHHNGAAASGSLPDDAWQTGLSSPKAEENKP